MAKNKVVKRDRATRQSGKRSPHRQPLEEHIRYRAYEIYLEKGARHGHDVDDWLQAERELSVINRSGGSSSRLVCHDKRGSNNRSGTNPVAG